MSDRTTVSGVQDLLLLAKVRDPDFNLSSFVRSALEHYIFEAEVVDPRREAARKAAESILNERKKQRKIIEENQSYEEKAREMIESRKRIFSREAGKLFRNPSLFERKLPEYDVYGDYLQTWNEVSDKLSERCGFPVTVDDCFAYVRAGGES